MNSGGGVADADGDDINQALDGLNKINSSSEGFEVAEVKRELQSVMQNYFGVFRRGDYMEKGVAALSDIREKVSNLHLKDKSMAFNTSRVEALELQNLFEVAEATAIASFKELRVEVHMHEMILKTVMMKIGYVILCMTRSKKL